jgi:hypothetical protein
MFLNTRLNSEEYFFCKILNRFKSFVDFFECRRGKVYGGRGDCSAGVVVDKLLLFLQMLILFRWHELRQALAAERGDEDLTREQAPDRFHHTGAWTIRATCLSSIRVSSGKAGVGGRSTTTCGDRRPHHFIPDFSNWKSHDDFEGAFARLYEDLKASA